MSLIEGVSMTEVSTMANSELSWSSGSNGQDEGTHTLPPVNGSTIPDVAQRLHSQVHICNHARCAANNPHYAVKVPTPKKKFLVARKHAYGGLDQKGEKKSTSSDHHGSHALYSLTNSLLEPRNGKAGSNGTATFGKKGRNSEDDRRLYTLAYSVLQHSRPYDISITTSGRKVAAERKSRPTSSASSGRSHSESSSGRSSVTQSQSTPTYRQRQKSRLSNANSLPIQARDQGSGLDDSPSHSSVADPQQQKSRKSQLSSATSLPTPATDQGSQRDGSLSPNSSITSASAGRVRIGNANSLPAPATDHMSPREDSSSPKSSITTASGAHLIIGYASSLPILTAEGTDLGSSKGDSPSPKTSVTTASASQPTLGNASSLPTFVTEAADPGSPKKGSSSSYSSVTTASASQLRVPCCEVSSRREEDGDDTASSPTASVGSNHGVEISSLTARNANLEGRMFDKSLKSTSDISGLQSPAGESSSSNLRNGSVNEESTLDSPTPSISSRPTNPETRTLSSITSIPSGASPNSSSTTPDSECSSTFLKSVVDEESTGDSPTTSVASGPAISESRTRSITSNKSRLFANSASTTSGGPSRTPTSKSASRLAGKVITNLKGNSRAGSATTSSSSAASAKKPSRISKRSISIADSSPLRPSPASQLARKFITDLRASTAAQKALRTKGVRSIEVRGGKAQSFSTTTVTSWNVTTTTVETSLAISDHSPEDIIDSWHSRSESAAASTKPPRSSSTMDTTAAGALTAATRAARDDTNGPKFRKTVRRSAFFDDVQAENETVSLKHGEVAERRLSEEWMTNHALEGVVKYIGDNDHRVKVLVHAFETLGTLSDSESLVNEDTCLKTQLEHEAISATQIAA